MALFSTCYLWASAIYFLAFPEVHYAIEYLFDFGGVRVGTRQGGLQTCKLYLGHPSSIS